MNVGIASARPEHRMGRRLQLARHRWRSGLSSSSRSIALHLRGASSGEVDIFAMFNAYWDKLSFSLPVSSNWKRVVDTSMESPFDIVEETGGPTQDSGSYSVGPRSVAVLISSAQLRTERPPVFGSLSAALSWTWQWRVNQQRTLISLK
jgi:hypothetical protein